MRDRIGYDGDPSYPADGTLLYDTGQKRWSLAVGGSERTMDHRGLEGDGKGLFLVGGMTSRQEVTGRVRRLTLTN